MYMHEYMYMYIQKHACIYMRMRTYACTYTYGMYTYA